MEIDREELKDCLYSSQEDQESNISAPSESNQSSEILKITKAVIRKPTCLTHLAEFKKSVIKLRSVGKEFKFSPPTKQSVFEQKYRNKGIVFVDKVVVAEACEARKNMIFENPSKPPNRLLWLLSTLSWIHKKNSRCEEGSPTKVIFWTESHSQLNEYFIDILKSENITKMAWIGKIDELMQIKELKENLRLNQSTIENEMLSRSLKMDWFEDYPQIEWQKDSYDVRVCEIDISK